MLDGEVLRDELTRLEDRRRRRVHEAAERMSAFMARHPEVDVARRSMRAEGIAAARRAAAGEPDAQAALRAAREYEALLAAALSADGLQADALEPVFDCSRCKDTGYTRGALRNLCECVLTRVLARMSQSARLRPECTFNQCDFDRFPEIVSVDGKPYNQRLQMQRLFAYCARWVDDFPDNEKPHLLLSGGVGLGKTFLLHAIAHRIIHEKRVTVLNTSAYHIVAEARKGFDALGSIELYLSAPVLILDDLGTEPLFPGVTAETLFTVLNERQSSGRHTLIATNLSLADLAERYGERLLSRLGRRETFVAVLRGRDVRAR
ncbi:MAG: ATP-binding protein [Christensenellales bacterium]|jgi:DNA replication protein DnaC